MLDFLKEIFLILLVLFGILILCAFIISIIATIIEQNNVRLKKKQLLEKLEKQISDFIKEEKKK